MGPVAEAKTDSAVLVRQAGVEVEHFIPGLQPRVASLDDIHSPGQRTQMNAFRSGASLYVCDVALQGLIEEAAGLHAVGAGQDPGVHNPAQGLSLIHISEPTRRTPISYAVFCLQK